MGADHYFAAIVAQSVYRVLFFGGSRTLLPTRFFCVTPIIQFDLLATLPGSLPTNFYLYAFSIFAMVFELLAKIRNDLLYSMPWSDICKLTSSKIVGSFKSISSVKNIKHLNNKQESRYVIN